MSLHPEVHRVATMAAAATLTVLASRVAWARDPAPSPASIWRPNSVSFDVTATPHTPAVDVSYDRAVTQHSMVGATFSYTFPRLGYWHLQGIEERLRARWWPKRAYDGLDAGVSLAFSHQVFVYDPSVSVTLMWLGAIVGYGFCFPNGLLLAMALEVRYGGLVEDEPALCTVAPACNVVHPGVVPRIAVGFGWAF